MSCAPLSSNLLRHADSMVSQKLGDLDFLLDIAPLDIFSNEEEIIHLKQIADKIEDYLNKEMIVSDFSGILVFISII